MTDQPYTNDDPAPHATSGRLTGSAAASSRESDEEEFHIGVGRPYPHLTTRAVEPSLERGTLITGGSTPRPATAGTRDPGTSGDAADVTTPSDASPLADDSAASSEPATGGGPESEAGEEAEEALADTTVPPYWAQRAASRSDDGTARRPGQPGGLGSTSTTQAQRGGGAGARSAPSSASRARVSGAATPAAGQAATARMTGRTDEPRRASTSSPTGQPSAAGTPTAPGRASTPRQATTPRQAGTSRQAGTAPSSRPGNRPAARLQSAATPPSGVARGASATTSGTGGAKAASRTSSGRPASGRTGATAAKATRAGRAASRPSSGATTSGRAGSASQRDRSGVDLSLPDLSDVDDDAFIENLSSGSGKPIPRYGWQGLVYRLTRLNFGPSKRDREELELRYRLNRQLRRTRGYCGYIGIASEKGGVGKTTLAALLAAELAEGRRESVGVADLNPDLGTLPDRFGVRPQHSIRDLLAHVDEIPWRYHVHDFMEKVPEMNVRVLAASTDRKIRHQLSVSDVELLAELFAPFFSFAILDNGTHITHEAMLGTLRIAHGMVLVTDNTKDGANLARKTLQFLTDNGFPEMRRRIVLAVVAKETASPVKVRAIERAFTDHVRELVVVPYDPALDGGGRIPFRDPNAVNKVLRPQTRAAVRRLAAIVIDDLVA